ncbi:hypothetical protein [Bacillus pinisoli]|uniref:hypothetical protein n=1 Tax=Bacillus pinisoli TaxID=2901866 RepID=UPI001FF2A0CB|nr:hypothetical protein [Bacillus pinisoli]
MELQEDMIFSITEKFIPNFSKAQTLRIIQLNEKTVKIEMDQAKARGAFPIDQFKGLIRDGSLILDSNDSLRNEVRRMSAEDTAS